MPSLALKTSKIHYGSEIIVFTLVEKPRLINKILIHIDPSGEVIVEAPPNTTKTIINNAVSKKARWILKQLEVIQQYKSFSLPVSLVSGETQFYLGRRYVLKVLTSKSQSVKMSQGRLIVLTKRKNKSSVHELLSKWYFDHSYRYLNKRVVELSSKLSWLDGPPPVRFSKMKKQWGSCTPSGTIFLNPSLIKAPRECIDYVILHEMCHLREHNHSSRFYGLLTQYMPDWKDNKLKLDSMAELILRDF